MTKQQIIEMYNAATKAEQDALTRAAREWLTKQGTTVGRDSLRHWRQNPMTRSPLAGQYLKAYRNAIKNRQMPEPA